MSELAEITTVTVVQYGTQGQVNVFFLTDPECPLQDCLISGDGWDGGKTVHGKVRLFGPKELVDALLNNDFRSVRNSKEGELPVVLSEDAAEALLEKLRVRDTAGQ